MGGAKSPKRLVFDREICYHSAMKTAAYWIRKLKLKQHPEGGYYREIYRSEETLAASSLPSRYTGDRSFSTSIFFLLKGSDRSRFHRLKSDELWYFHAGSSLTIHIISPSGSYSTIRLGPNPDKQQTFQCAIRRDHWFGATVDDTTSFALVGCTVAPGFNFSDFEMADRPTLSQLCPGKKSLVATLTLT